ncbi:MAG TPA: class I tRNA ligase family protein [Flavipsychrobacter sp.]|nr:class I tRNA ligase family protein [Flavipsychrobacter sp.]
MEYTFGAIEQKWREYWKKNQVYKVTNDTSKPKYYILDMFPYPSGAGLHVGHPLGYIASDIYARYKKMKGFNVLHPMGFDAFGLPAEQYALETGQHPAVTTEKNIARYKEQLDNIGFCYDWEREVRTSDAAYYKWTQWIFLQLFHSWYDRNAQKARPIIELIAIFEREGNSNLVCPGDENLKFDAVQWQSFDEKQQRDVLMHYRMAYQGYAEVWWCEGLGTVLANDEVVNGVSERGGFPVERKKMRQWFLRITEYADRLIESLDKLEWSEAMKEMQRNWIGKSIGAQVTFQSAGSDFQLEVFTTRPDTIFGVDFMVIAPEHALVEAMTTAEQKDAITKYQDYVKSRSERERMAEVKQVTGAFTGAYVLHPFTQKQIPVWTSEYVLAGYGTGAIMAVPSGDSRDHAFAKHFNIPVTNIFGDKYNGDEAYTAKEGIIENSDFISGKEIKEATALVVEALKKMNAGVPKINYKLRDAGFSRQRYWGEPFPIVYQDGIAYAIDEPQLKIPGEKRQLPVELPMVEHYKPGAEGEGPLANVEEWVTTEAGRRETSTMPGYAGSSWYFLRYMDPDNDAEFASRNATDYWREVDLYIGGTEHAVGHLLYSRMWTKALYDLGFIGFDEPFKKLVNQGMIQGSSRFVYELIGGLHVDTNAWDESSEPVSPSKKMGITGNVRHPNFFVSSGIYERIEKGTMSEAEIGALNEFINSQLIKFNKPGLTFRISVEHIIPHRVDVNIVDGYDLNIEKFKKWKNGEYANAEFILEDGKYICGSAVEKMSKSKYNVVNPDDIVAQYGADTFRMYEMFLGPIDVSKPWDTKGIEGVHRFLKKLWRLYFDEQKGWIVTEEKATETELKALHKTIRKIADDIEKFSFNTSVSQFMICVNELAGLNCHKREILEPLALCINPFAPHLAEELWHQLGYEDSVVNAAFPAYEEKYVTESSKNYPVAINGKPRLEMNFPLDAEQQFIEEQVLGNEHVQKYLEGKQPKKIIFVKGKMINIVVS